MSEEKRLAVLIDSDNVSAKYAHFVMNEIVKYGVPTYKRVYGDWEKGGNGWHTPAMNYSIMPVQQTSYVSGKNATDFSMIIDAMDILYTGNVDGFVLVTSDSDFTRLAIRLREAGKLVVGIGELKTPRPFTISCHHFCYLNQIADTVESYDEQAIRKAVMSFVAENQEERLDLAKINAVLTSKFGNINFDELGYKRFSNFIDSFPELRRSNTFVTLRKKRTAPPVPSQKPQEVTAESVSAAISEYFSQHEPENDNMLKLESYLNSRFGKIDFAKFGSSKFARFIDKLPQFTRTGTFIRPAASEPDKINADSYRKEVIAYAGDNMPEGGNIGQLNNRLMERFGRNYYKNIGFGDFKAALDSVSGVRVEGNRLFLSDSAVLPEKKAVRFTGAKEKAVFSRIQQYAAENMPDGGNLGQLNNELISVYGRDYIDTLGYGDFRALLSAVPDIRISKNRAYSMTDNTLGVSVSETAKAVAEVIAEVNAPIEYSEQPIETEELPETEKADIASASKQTDIPDVQKITTETTEEKVYEKPEINAVKREIIHFAASEDGGSLARLSEVLSAKYGRDFLKQLGFTSMKKLTSELNGTVVRDNKLYISEEFAKQTDEIERFVNEFARSEGSHSIRSLGIKLKERFDGFDFRNYGFSKFTDFINAIDGVEADRYHIRPVEQ